MQDLVAHESDPTHPLGARDSWPVTGPIYGMEDPELKPEPAKTIWQRLLPSRSVAPEISAALPGNSPIWY